jgi:hypothetical protein
VSITVLNTDAGLSGKTVANLEDAQTVTGAKHFDRDPSAPFTVSANSAVVTNLDADKIDGQDYSSGSWTPVLAFGGSSAGITYSTQTGSFVRIGKLYLIECHIVLTSNGSGTGTATITGVPAAFAGTPVSSVIDFAAGGSSMTGAPFAVGSASTLTLVQTTAAVRTALTHAEVTDTSNFRISLAYIAA